MAIKKFIILITISLFITSIFFSYIGICEESNYKILYVDDDGSVKYKSIQNAINNASSGDIVYVYNGIYFENIKIDKSIILRGEGKNNTIIDGNGIGNVVEINANDVLVNNLRMQDSGPGLIDCVIHLKSENITISNNIISSFIANGIYINNSNSNNISNNFIYDNNQYSGFGIKIQKSENNDILNNNISLNAIGIFCSQQSMGNNIFYNSFVNNTKYNAIDYGSNNTWYNYKLKIGNYWDDYNGSDNDNNGIGDQAYNISIGGKKDLYPLMTTYNETILKLAEKNKNESKPTENTTINKDKNKDDAISLFMVFIFVISICLFIIYYFIYIRKK